LVKVFTTEFLHVLKILIAFDGKEEYLPKVWDKVQGDPKGPNGGWSIGKRGALLWVFGGKKVTQVKRGAF